MRKLFLLVIILSTTLQLNADQFYIIATEELPPYNYTENGKVKGISTEIVRAVFNEANVNYKIISYPWARAYNLTLNHNKYFIYSIAKSGKRKKLFKWVFEVAPTKSYLYKLAERKDIVVKKFLDINNYVIGAIRDDVGAQFLKKKNIKRITLASSNEKLIKMLIHGRVDIIEFDEATFNYLIEESSYRKDIFKKVLFNKEISGKQFLACHVNMPEKVILKINNAYKKIKKIGKYKKILKDWNIE